MAGGLSEDSGRRMRRGQRGGQREERRTAGVAGGEDSEEDIGRRGQPQWWILNRAVLHLKGNFLIKRVVFI